MSVLDRFRLDGKKLFISGGSRGLGKEMAVAISEAGADIVITGRTQDSLDQTVQEIRDAGRNCESLTGDMSDPDECERICRDALKQFGPFDILINNLGGRRINIPTEELELKQWQEVLNLNLTSTFLCSKLIGEEMIRNQIKGRIISISSISGVIATRGIGGRSYETAKSAVIHFTRTLAADWAPYGITANIICPGGFMTEPNQKWKKENPELIEQLKEQVPMKELGPPEDMGPLAVYLASDASRYMTGATLVLDGGYTIW